MHDFRYTISQSAIKAAVPRLSGLKSKVPLVLSPELTSCVAVKLDEALQKASLVEILDSWRLDEETYLAKLLFEGDVKLIGLLGHERFPRQDYAFSGSSSKILISVCSFPEAAKSFSLGQWKSMDGAPVFAPAKEEREPVASVRRFQRKAKEAEVQETRVVTLQPTQNTWTSHEVPPDVKSCTSCGRFYPLSSFYLARPRKDGVRIPRSVCKECFREQRNRTRRGKALFVPIDVTNCGVLRGPSIAPHLAPREISEPAMPLHAPTPSLASWSDKPELQATLTLALERESQAVEALKDAIVARTSAGNVVTRILAEFLAPKGTPS